MVVASEKQNRVHDLETLELRLAQARDELRLKLHLARADADDVWDGLEVKWQHFRSRLADLREAAGEAGGDLSNGVRALGHELAEGYDKLRRAL